MHFALDEQIASQPQAVRTLLARNNHIPALDLKRPLIFTGIGTSLHACHIAASWFAELTGLRPSVINAHDLALTLPIRAEDQIVVVSHRGTKRFPNAVLVRARECGAFTVVITGEGVPEPEADLVIRTCPDERSGTHTVSYMTALIALGQLIIRSVGKHADPLLSALVSVPAALDRTLALPAPQRLAEQLAGREPILVAGFGLDAVTAAEAALKLKEGTYQWAEGMAVELALHGPPAAFHAGMGAITITPALDDGGRIQTLRTQLQDLAVEAITCGDRDEDLLFAPVHPLARPLLAIVPVQRLVAEIARIRGTNPDVIHCDVEPWTTALARVIL